MRLMPKPKIKNAHRLWMCALMMATVLGAVLYYLPFAYPQNHVNAQPLLTGWRYVVEPGGTPVAVDLLDHFIPFDAHETITLTRRMTERADSPHLLLRLDKMRAQVFLDDAPLFDNLENPPGENPGSGDHLIALPEDYRGRELSIVVTSPYPAYAVSPVTICFGDAASLAALVVARSASNMVLLFVLLIIGLLLMGAALFSVRGKQPARERWANFCFGLFAVIFGLSLPTTGDLFRALYPPLLGSNVYLTLWYLCPLPLTCYLALKSTVYKRAALLSAAFFWLFTLSTLLGALFGLWALPPMATAFTTTANIIGVLMFAAVIALEAVRKNTLFRFMAPGFALLISSMVLSFIDGLYPLKEAVRISGVLLALAMAGLDGLRAFIASHRAEERERQLVAIRVNLAAEQLKVAEAHNEETRLLRHEIRHHLAAMTVLQREGRLAEIGEYLGVLNIQQQEMDSVLYCEHPLVNAVLSKAAADCKREDIAFTCEADVPPNIPLPEADLSTLLLNMLENAVEAARLVDAGKRSVTVQVRVKDAFLVIACHNARHGAAIMHREGRFLTTKKNASLHGYGIAAMLKIAEKHGSQLNIDYDDASFSVKTILPLLGEAV